MAFVHGDRERRSPVVSRKGKERKGEADRAGPLFSLGELSAGAFGISSLPDFFHNTRSQNGALAGAYWCSCCFAWWSPCVSIFPQGVSQGTFEVCCDYGGVCFVCGDLCVWDWCVFCVWFISGVVWCVVCVLWVVYFWCVFCALPLQVFFSSASR